MRVIIVLIIVAGIVISFITDPILEHKREMEEINLRKMDKDMEYLKLADRLEEEKLSRREREARLFRSETK